MNFYNNFLYWSNSLSIILINIIFYIILFTLFIFIILLTQYKNIKYINQLKKYTYNKLFLNNFIIILLSMSGIPPFSGFCGKFLIILYIFNKNNIIFILLIIFLNFNAMYFYIQNLRFSIKEYKIIKFKINNFNSIKIDYFNNKISYIFIINFISIILMYDIYIYVYNIFIYMYL